MPGSLFIATESELDYDEGARTVCFDLALKEVKNILKIQKKMPRR